MATSNPPIHPRPPHSDSIYPQASFRRPTYPSSLNSNTTHASALRFGPASHPYPLPSTILTRADLRESVETFEVMLTAAKGYRSALMALSSATSTFAKALEDCARLKGAQAPPSLVPSAPDGFGSSSAASSSQSRLHDFFNSACAGSDLHDGMSSPGADGEDGEKLNPGERLMAASGLHFMTANLEQVLSATFYKSFEIPLLDVYDTYRQQLADRQTTYEAEVSTKTRAIRETEIRNMRQGTSGKGRKHRNPGRDLDSFRKGLKELQDQVEAVEKVKQLYYLEVAGGEYEVWKSVAENISLVVKSEVEVYDRVASKATSDPTLELMVASIPDPFDSYKETISSSSQAPEIYSILPPLSSILTPAQAIARRSMVDIGQVPYIPPPSSSYPSPSISDHPHLDSSTHWVSSSLSSDSDSAALDVPPLSVVNYESDHDDDQDFANHAGPSALFDSPPMSACNDSDAATPRATKDWPPLMTLGAPAIPFHTAQVKTPTPLRNVISLASTSTASTNSATITELDRQESPPLDHKPQHADREESGGTTYLDTIRPSASSKRASVNSGLSVLQFGTGGSGGSGMEESLMSQLPPSELGSDSDLDPVLDERGGVEFQDPKDVEEDNEAVGLECGA